MHNRKARWLCALVSASLVLQAAGCAMTEPVETPVALKQKQASALSSLQAGASRQAVLDSLGYPIRRWLVAGDARTQFARLDYIEVHNPDTLQHFGLVFEDQRLTALLPERVTNQFWQCREAAIRRGDLWVQQLDAYRVWLRAQNVMGTPFDFSVSRPATRYTTSADVSTFLGYLPILIIAAPFLLIAKLTGEFDRSEQESNDRMKLQAQQDAHILADIQKAQSDLQPGMPLTAVKAQAAPLEQIVSLGGMDLYQYRETPREQGSSVRPLGLAFADQQLVLMEHPNSMVPPYVVPQARDADKRPTSTCPDDPTGTAAIRPAAAPSPVP